MGLYLGKKKFYIYLNGIKYILKPYAEIPIVMGVFLLSSDKYVLKDCNGLFLTVKEGD